MNTFAHDGEEFELVTDLDEMEVGDAEIIEAECGLDLREVTIAPLSKQLQVFLLISLRRKRPSASLDDIRRIKLGPVLAAFNGKADAADPAAEPEVVTVDAEVLSPTSAGSEQLSA